MILNVSMSGKEGINLHSIQAESQLFLVILIAIEEQVYAR